MGGRDKDRVENWTIIFGIQFMMLWAPGEYKERQEIVWYNPSRGNFWQYVFLLVGHGQSEGERVQISAFSLYVRDVFKHIDQVTADNTGIPIFMFGH